MRISDWSSDVCSSELDGSAAIHQQILVARDSQRAIVLGKGGARIKQIGQAAREEMAEQLGRKVHLFLHVKVKPDWAEDRGVYRDMGLDWVEGCASPHLPRWRSSRRLLSGPRRRPGFNVWERSGGRRVGKEGGRSWWSRGW